MAKKLEAQLADAQVELQAAKAAYALARLALIVSCQDNVKRAERRLSEALDDLSRAEELPVVDVKGTEP